MFMSVLMIVLCMCLSIQRGMQGKVNNLQGQLIQCRQYAAWHPKRYRCVFNRLSWHAVAQERQRFGSADMVASSPQNRGVTGQS